MLLRTAMDYKYFRFLPPLWWKPRHVIVCWAVLFKYRQNPMECFPIWTRGNSLVAFFLGKAHWVGLLVVGKRPAFDRADAVQMQGVGMCRSLDKTRDISSCTTSIRTRRGSRWLLFRCLPLWRNWKTSGSSMWRCRKRNVWPLAFSS